MNTSWALSSLLIVWLLNACRPAPLASPAATQLSPVQTPSLAAITIPAAPTFDRLQRVAQEVVLDLAERLKLEADSIQIELVQPDEFPAGDLGCPQPERTPPPIPAFVTGQRIVLQARNVRYEYRTAGTQLVYCGVR